VSEASQERLRPRKDSLVNNNEFYIVDKDQLFVNESHFSVSNMATAVALD